MRGSECIPEILVVAVEDSARRELAAALEPEMRVRALAPEDLLRRAALVDAPAAVASVRPGDLEALRPLRDLPAGRALVLVVRDWDERAVERMIASFAPVHVLTHPAPAAALRLAVRQALPSGPAGQGARPGQRRAPALLGVSAAIREILDEVVRVADSRSAVLILGETGTGKELVARAIHGRSSRAHGPIVAVNCGALPETLLESELFGFRRGAFTGAERSKQGLFEQANGGTLFLDEIGDTSPALQAKLLRAIEEQEIRPLGATTAVRVDVRITSATHRDLEAAVESGTFRQDLLYRLNTLTIQVPPLRRRRVDIPFLAQHFAEEYGEMHARRITLGDDFLDALSQHDFPGNVRELRNLVERAIALARPGEVVSATHLPTLVRRAPSARRAGRGTLRERIEQVEVQAIREALREHEGNRTRAARALGLTRVGLRQKMRRLGLVGSRGPISS